MTVTLASLRARILRILLVLLPLIVGVPRAYASLYDLSRVGHDGLAQQADVVTLGKVVDTRSEWRNGRIFTTVTLNVEGTLKGSSRGSVAFQVAGGKVGDMAMSVSSAPSFTVGERSVVFLKDTGEDARVATFHVYGGQLGKVAIEQDAAGHDTVRWIRPELRRVDLVPLGTFTQHILDVLAHQLLDTVKGGVK